VGAGVFITIAYIQGSVVTGPIGPVGGDQIIYLPKLAIARADKDVIISYPASEEGTDYSGYLLQEGDIGSSNILAALWNAAAKRNQLFIRLNPTSSQKLFRLAK